MFAILIDGLIEFKTDRQQREWESGNLSKKLTWIVRVIAVASYYIFGKKIVVTDIFRTQLEYDIITKWKPGKKKKLSVHTFWRGVDVRVTGDHRHPYLKKDEAKVLVRIGNAFKYDKKRPWKKTAVYGDKKHIDHLHLQSLT